MKRLPPDAASVAPSRRRRTLSAEEQELWETVARNAKPLKRPRALKVAPIETATPEAVTASAAQLRGTKAAKALLAQPSVQKPSPPPLVTLGRRERSAVARGKRDIDARLDLHGMTQARAHRELTAFLYRAQADGCAFVLVITGKGRTGAADSARGVLRRLVPEWLSLPDMRPLVIGFEEAAISHGGAGALYVRVRRGR